MKVHLTLATFAASAMLLLPVAATAQVPDYAKAPATVQAPALPLLTIDEALAAERGQHARRVLQWLKIMEATVAAGKQPGFSEAAWDPLRDMIDQARFRRVGNFGEVMDWNGYVPMLTMWAKGSYWKGRVRRVREIGNLVYVEAEERMSTKGEVRDDGGYDILHSLSVYEFGPDGKLTGLWVYDQSRR